jgi:putative FmdB family regulatory protein
MPLYEYECDACGGRFEVIQKFSEVSEQCRTCGKGPVRRLQSAPGIQFKGTGWYVTDYAQKGKSGDQSSAGKSGDSEKTESRKSDGGSSDAPAKSESTKSESTSSESSKSESSKSESSKSTPSATGKD